MYVEVMFAKFSTESLLYEFFKGSEDFFVKLRLSISSHLSTLSEYFLLVEIQ